MGLQKTAHRKRMRVGARRRYRILLNVLRMKSARQFRCYIVANQRTQPSDNKFRSQNLCPKFGHLQRKRKSSFLIQTVAKLNNERNVIKWQKQCDSYITEIQSLDIKSYLAKIFTKNLDEKAHEKKADYHSNTKDDDPHSSLNPYRRISNSTSLYEDLMSLRHIRFRSCSFQCYLMLHQKQATVPKTHFFNYEILRLRTYSNYPTNGTKSALVLAQNGFVYIGSGEDDKVTCYECQSTKVNWLEPEVVTEVHRSMSPDCSMVTGVNSDNVPITIGQKSFDELIQSCSIRSTLDTEVCQDVKKEDNETPSLEIQIDAAPIACQEQVNINYDASVNSVTESHTIPNRNIPTFNQHARKDTSSFRSYATLEQAFVTLPLSVQPPIASSSSLSAQSSNSPLALTQPLSRNEPPLSSDTNSTERNPMQSNPNHCNSPVSESNSIFSASNVSSNLQSDTVASQPITTDPKKPDLSQPPKNNSRNTGPTYSELGIITERPKRPEYAIKRERIKTFSSWQRSHHIHVDDLADAGFYYAGYGDCARCFFCGGGLRNWEDEDDVWVEHARWFPKCAFIRQLMGQNFVDTVQELNKTKDKISFQMVTDVMGLSASAFQLDSKSNPLKRDPAVKTMMEFGYPEKLVLEVANLLKSQENTLMSADVLLKKLNECNVNSPELNSKHLKGLTNTTTKQDLESIRQMKERNNELRQQTMCKICMDKDVEVVFLPCGHLVSCAECAGALKDCAVCRKPVKGTIRAFLG